MKPVIIFLFLLIALLQLNPVHAQQDIHFSQYYDQPILRNPALAGIFNGNVRFTSAYRNQWQGVTTPYKTTALGAEFKLIKGLKPGDFLTIGFQGTSDIAGDSKLKRTQFFPVINYHKLLNEDYNTLLGFGLMGGYVGESFDPSKLQFDDQFVNGAYSSSNPTSQTFTRTGFHYADISAGLSISSFINNNTKIYLAAGVFHITQPSLSFLQNNSMVLNRKYGINVGLSKHLETNDRLMLFADYYMQGGDRIAQGGFLYTYNLDYTDPEANLSISGGAVMRWKDAMVPVVKLNVNKLSIGLSYDVNVSSLKTASNYRGGFELTLTYTDLWNAKNISAEAVSCPTQIR